MQLADCDFYNWLTWACNFPIFHSKKKIKKNTNKYHSQQVKYLP